MASISAAALAELRRLATAAYPSEGCGVLIGSDDGILEVTSGRNLREDRARDRYELDPGAIVAAERWARERGLDVVGFWHSHPDHPARPSAFDTERAWAEYLYVICATTEAGVGEVSAQRLGEDGDFVAEGVVVFEAAGGAVDHGAVGATRVSG